MLHTIIDASVQIPTEVLRKEAAERISKSYGLPYQQAYDIAGSTVDEMLRSPNYQHIIKGALISHVIVLARRKIPSGIEERV